MLEPGLERWPKKIRSFSLIDSLYLALPRFEIPPSCIWELGCAGKVVEQHTEFSEWQRFSPVHAETGLEVSWTKIRKFVVVDAFSFVPLLFNIPSPCTRP